MTILAPVAAGVPPVGIGLYARGRVGAPGPWQWYVGREWSFANVDQMRADPVAATQRAIAEAIANGRSGAILDWETDATEAQVRAVTALVVANAARTRVGFTSYPSWRYVGLIAQLTHGLMWGSPQLYFDPATNARGWEHWRSAFGARLIPSAKGYVVGAHTSDAMAAALRTPAGYAAYLESVPRAGGVIIWPNHPVPQYMLDAIHARWGGIATPLLVPWAALSVLDSWPGLVLLLALALFALYTRYRHAL